MKKFFKNNLKVLIAFIVGIVISGVGVYGATLITTDEVMYTDTKTAKTAIDELYNKVSSMYTATEYSSYGTTKYNEGYTAGRKSITDNPTTLTLGSTNGTAVTVTAGYYNKVNTTAVYNSGYNTGYSAGQAAGISAGKDTFYNTTRISVAGESSFSGNAGIKDGPRVNTNPYGVECLVYWKISRGYSNGTGSSNHRVWIDDVLVYQGDNSGSGTARVRANGTVKYAADGCHGSADRDGYTLTVFVCPNS